MGPTGLTGHNSKDGTSMSVRVNRYGQWYENVAENISFGAKSGLEVILQLLVDDGVKSRGHRRNLFDMNLECIGVATGPHDAYDTMTVIDYAKGYASNTTTAIRYVNAPGELVESEHSIE